MSNKDVEIEKCLERLNECENKLHKIRQTNQTIHMIMPSKDTLYNGRKGIGFENPSYFEKAKNLRPGIYDKKVIGLGYTSMFLIHSGEALEIKKFKRARENKIEFAYDYENLNASYVNEKLNFLDYYFQEIINPDFEKIDSPFQQTSSLKPYVPNVTLEKIIIDLEDEVSDEALEIEKFKRARESKIEFAYDYGNLNASYVNEKIYFSDDYFQEIINLDFEKIDSPFLQTSSLKPYVSNVILEKIIIDLEDKVMSLLEKEKANLKTIESLKSKDFEMSENAISESENQSENDCHVVEKECDKVENSKVIAPRMFKLSVSQSVSLILMSKMPCDSKNVESKLKRKRCKRKSSKQNGKQVNNDVSHANSNYVHFSDLDTFSSDRRPKHSGVIWKKKGSSNTSNVDLSSVSLLKLNKNVKRYSRKDLLSCNNSHLGETSSAYVCNDYMNVSCNSRMCDLFDENNLFIFDDESVRIFPVSKMPFRKKPHDSLNVRSKPNLNKSLAKAVHRWLPKLQPLAEPIAKWFPRVKHSGCSKHMTGNRALLTNFVEKFLGTVRFGNSLPMMKFKKDHLCSTCKQGKIHRKHHKSKTYFASDKLLYLLHMDLCGPMRVKSINGKRYVLVVVDDYSRYTWVFFLHSNDEASDMIISFFKKTQVNLQLQVQRVRTDNGTEFKNKTLAKFFDEIMKSSPTNVQTSINEEVFHEVSESFQGESFSSSLNDDVQQIPEEVILPQTNTQLISNNMIPYVDEASTSHNVFNKRLEDAYFDATLRDADWVSAMQEELDQFARLKVWRLVPQPKGKTIIKTKWIFKNKKDESSLVIRNKARLVAVGFVSKQYPDHVYALDKALYGLKHAPRAWYDILSEFLIDSGFQKGSIDTTIFIKKKGFVSKQNPDHVYALDKALYGLKQVPRA
nr:retrotransposon protein, putative, unclassified [Tanacetum cinerariifolium]